MPSLERGRKAAFALAYAAEDPAPRLLCKARGRDAERMLELAEDAGVRVVEDGALAALLETADAGAFVPEACWEAVARVLAFVMAVAQEEGSAREGV